MRKAVRTSYVGAILATAALTFILLAALTALLFA
jgi:hypothetical protein